MWGSIFSPSTSSTVWVLGLEPKIVRLGSRHFHMLSHLASSNLFMMPISFVPKAEVPVQILCSSVGGGMLHGIKQGFPS